MENNQIPTVKEAYILMEQGFITAQEYSSFMQKKADEIKKYIGVIKENDVESIMDSVIPEDVDFEPETTIKMV